jgi:hypothetical protein
MCFANKDRNLITWLPLMGSPFTRDEMADATSIAFLPTIKSTSTWIERTYVGQNTVSYVFSSLYETTCEGHQISSNAEIMHLIIDPESRLVVEVEHALFFDRLLRVLTHGIAGLDGVQSRLEPHREREERATAAINQIWGAQRLEDVDAALWVLEVDAVFCSTARPRADCVRGRDAIAHMFKALASPRRSSMPRRVVHNELSAWISYTDHTIDEDGSAHRLDGELLITLDWVTRKVYRITHIVDKAELDAFCTASPGQPRPESLSVPITGAVDENSDDAALLPGASSSLGPQDWTWSQVTHRGWTVLLASVCLVSGALLATL